MFDKEKLIQRIERTTYTDIPKLAEDMAKMGPDIMRDPDILKLIIDKNYANRYVMNVKDFYVGDTWTKEEYDKLIASNRDLCINAIEKRNTCGFVSRYFPKINLANDLEICEALIKNNLRNAENIPCGRENVKDAILEAAKNPYTSLKELSADFIKWMNEAYTTEELASVFENNPCHCIDFECEHYFKNSGWKVSIFINPDVLTSEVLAKGFETAKEIDNSYFHSPARFINNLKYFSAYGSTDLLDRLDRKTVMSIPDIRYNMLDAVKAYFQPVAKNYHDDSINKWVVDDKEFVLKWIEKEHGSVAISKAAPSLWYDKDVINAALLADKNLPTGSDFKNTEFLLEKGAIEMNLDTAIFLVKHTFEETGTKNISKLRRLIELSPDLTKEEVGILYKYAFSIDNQCITGIPKGILIELFESTFVDKQHGINNSADWKKMFEAVRNTEIVRYGQGKVLDEIETKDCGDTEEDYEM